MVSYYNKEADKSPFVCHYKNGLVPSVDKGRFFHGAGW